MRAVRAGHGTIVGVLVSLDGNSRDAAAANKLSKRLGLYPAGHWRKTGEHGRPEFFPAGDPGIGHDWIAFLLGLKIDQDDEETWQAISDAWDLLGARPAGCPAA